ncbi:hypothetical protein [Streptomyces asoensis]|uniref:hypothetical protein n=1 Tax=Streptomyces asoensis TaxID=249586 RepID=UPI0034058919
MPRGRHRHSPPLHRLLPPSAIAGVSLVCALGPWVFTEPAALRGLAAAAAATAILGAVVMRRWDVQAGKQVADLARSRAGDEWRYEERVAELESDLDESRELRVKLEQRLRSKRAELAGLRNEHAALLRRYATAETERASALEGRRLLEIEAAPTPALPAARSAQDVETAGAVGTRDADVDVDVQDLGNAEGADSADVVEGADASEAGSGAREAAGTDETEEVDDTDDGDDTEDGDEAEGEAKAEAVFSPEGSKLFLRAQAALDRLDSDRVRSPQADDDAGEEPARAAGAEVGAQAADGGAEAAQEDEAQGNPEAVDEHARATAPHQAHQTEDTGTEDTGTDADAVDAERDTAGANPESDDAGDAADAAGAAAVDRDADEADRAAAGAFTAGRLVDDVEPVRPAPAPDAVSAPVAAGATADADADAGVGAGAGAIVPRPAGAVQRRPSGHFAVPTAVAVVPAAQPLRRPTAEGGFDFFGTKSASPHALEAVQNEDLADVVGQEALALHKAESEAGEFKPVDEAARGVGQVIDLTAHDETEQIDLQGLRSAVS